MDWEIIFSNVGFKRLTPWTEHLKPDFEVIKIISCSTQLSIKVFLLINVKMAFKHLGARKIAFSAYLSLKLLTSLKF